MKRLLLSLTLGVMAVSVPLAGSPVPVRAATMMHATLEVAKAYKHNMHFAHTMAAATLSTTRHDSTVKLTASHLPKPSTIKAMAYVVWLTDGAMKERAGALKVHGGMAAL